MKKKFLYVLLLMFGLLVGCTADKPTKYGQLLTESSTKTINDFYDVEIVREDVEIVEEDLSKAGLSSYCHLASYYSNDEEEIEKVLKEEFYGTWYSTKNDSSIEINEQYFGNIEYGVYYAIHIGDVFNLVRLYELGNEQNAFFLYDRKAEYYKNELLCITITVIDASGQQEIYRNMSHVDYEILKELKEK